MKQILARFIKPSDTNGDVLTTVSGKTAWKAPGATSGGMPLGGTTGQVLTKLSATDYDAGWQTPSSGGGGGGVGKDLRWTVPAGVTSIDEFNDGALDPAWVRVDGAAAPASAVTWTEGNDVLSMVHASATESGVHGLMRPIGAPVALGDAFTACLRLMTATQNYPMVGLVLSDSNTYGSGSQAMSFATADAAISDQQNYSRAWSGWNTSGGVGVGSVNSPRGGLTYLRLVCTAVNTWRTDISPDGVGWIKGAATLTQALTPAYVGLITASFGAAKPFAGSFEFIRRVSGVS